MDLLISMVIVLKMSSHKEDVVLYRNLQALLIINVHLTAAKSVPFQVSDLLLLGCHLMLF
jgi:hypothetical protein